MRHGLSKSPATPDIQVADCSYNAEQAAKLMKKAAGHGAKILVLPGCASPATPVPTCFYNAVYWTAR